MRSSARRLSWIRMAALAAALCAILLIASGASLWHVHSDGTEATCPICHLAHMPALSGMAPAALGVPEFVAWVQPAETQVAHVTFAALEFPPRAPPA